jgi:hypothetical protein
MATRSEINEVAGPPFVSTGHLPLSELVRILVAEAYKRFSSNAEGENSRVYPALARVPRDLFGLCVGTSGNVYASSEAEAEFSRALSFYLLIDGILRLVSIFLDTSLGGLKLVLGGFMLIGGIVAFVASFRLRSSPAATEA